MIKVKLTAKPLEIMSFTVSVFHCDYLGSQLQANISWWIQTRFCWNILNWWNQWMDQMNSLTCKPSWNVVHCYWQCTMTNINIPRICIYEILVLFYEIANNTNNWISVDMAKNEFNGTLEGSTRMTPDSCMTNAWKLSYSIGGSMEAIILNRGQHWAVVQLIKRNSTANHLPSWYLPSW